MTRTGAMKPAEIPSRLITEVCKRLASDNQVRRTLPSAGRIHIDRQLPFLCVYRRPLGRSDEGTDRLVIGGASYLIASGATRQQSSLRSLVQNIVQVLSAEFGAFLIVEIWSGPESDAAAAGEPGFTIFGGGARTPSRTLDALNRSLRGIRVGGIQAEVEARADGKPAPPRMSPVLTPSQARALNCSLIGVEVRPIHRDPATGNAYPLIRRALLRELTRALLQTFYQFSRRETTHGPPHYHALGRRAQDKAVWEVDHGLAQLSDAFDFLLQVSPANSDSAWAEFERHRFERSPAFLYRPKAFDPALLKRELWDIRIEGLEDPTLGALFREKRLELDAQLTMLGDLDTPRFLFGSLQAFGRPDSQLLELARMLLERLPPRARDDGTTGSVDAQGFAELALEEISQYRRNYPGLTARVFVRSDTTGLMVSKGNLLVGRSTRIPLSRVDALLQHELGTHMVTYFNGRAQPFRQLSVGLAGYHELQEGLAVLAEYLVGGLSRARLRLLAGRVIAVYALVEGATFVETFRELNGTWGFSQRTAFVLTMRVYRGGGLTKDMLYLRGLASLLGHLKDQWDPAALFVGKIAGDHLPIIRELQLRGVLVPMPMRPRYLERPETAERLNRLRAGVAVIDLAEGVLR
jgi:uncharacterized protein (TIGR02421 family)